MYNRALLIKARGIELNLVKLPMLAALTSREIESVRLRAREESGRAVVVDEYSPQRRRSARPTKRKRWKFVGTSFMLIIVCSGLRLWF
jgi:hypothetical protein